MKNIILILILLFPSITYADELLHVYKDSKCIKKVGVIKAKQLKTLVSSTKEYNSLLTAEKEGRVKIFLQDAEWEISTEKQFETTIKIQWFSIDKVMLKELTFDLKLNSPYSSMRKYRIWYRK